MRKSQVKQALELAAQIEKANSQIKKYTEQNNMQPARELLCDCQNAAIAIGTLIENTEGERHPTITLLEEYCEVAYQVYQEFEINKNVSASKIYKLLKQTMVRISNSIKHDIQIRTEVVFLPYKASMWDSLESVWRAADADKDCDTYVIPIPYYDKNPDGSFCKMHYEADQFPDYVPVTKYDAFDFEMHRPDLIFIHNPYDNMNYVTSVHPFFYSDHLKQFTEKLVYIPYFVLGEISLKDEREIEEMQHFCTVSGVLNADRVIVQSEEMKQVYLKVLLAATNDYSDNARTYWDKKILGLGSPKFDKIAQTKWGDFEIPDAWKKIIEKPDKSRKKIILYNTTINGLLTHNEKMLEKIACVFRAFKEKQDEIALLWRPHPLIESTLTSMRPQLWDAYRKIKENYIQEGWGIYDDTADLDRAIFISDSYFGDYSSVVQLYKKTGKPVMIQDCSVENGSDEKKQCVRVLKSLLYQDKLIFASVDYNALFSADILNGNITYIGSFCGEKKDQTNLFSQLVQNGTSVLICPCLASSAYIYDCRKEEIQEWCIQGLCNHPYQLFPILEKGKKALYVIPTFGSVFGKLNREMSGLEYKINFQKEYEKHTGKKYKVASDSGVFVYKERIYFALCEDSFLVKFCCKTHQMIFLKIAEVKSGFYKILGTENILYMLSEENKLITYDLEKEQVNLIIDFSKYNGENNLFREGFFWKESVYFVSFLSNKCVKYNPDRKELAVHTLEYEWKFKTEEQEIYHFTYIDNNKTVFFVSNKNHLIWLNENDTTYHRVTFHYDENVLLKQLKTDIRKDGENVLQENEILGDLKELLDQVITDNEKKQFLKSRQLVGKIIFDQVVI